MTREELKAIMPDITEEQITAFLNKHHEELNKNKADDAAQKAALEAARKAQKEAEKALKELQDGKLSDEEKVQKALAEAEASKAEYATKLNRLEVEKMFVEAGIASDSYNPILDSIVTADSEASKKTAESFVSVLKSQKEAVEKALKDELSKGAPAPQRTEGGADPITEKGGKDLTAAEQIAQSIAKGNSTTAKSAKDALSYYSGGNNNEGN